MHTGMGTSTIFPVEVSFPVCWAILKVMMLLVDWLAANKKVPVGSIAKLRGFCPSVN